MLVTWAVTLQGAGRRLSLTATKCLFVRSAGKTKCREQKCCVWCLEESHIWGDRFYSLIGFFASQTVYLLTEYTITMYDTKKKELRWNATYFDYAASLPDEDIKYSKNLIAVSFCLSLPLHICCGFCISIFWFFSIINRSACLSDFCAVDLHLPVFILYML